MINPAEHAFHEPITAPPLLQRRRAALALAAAVLAEGVTAKAVTQLRDALAMCGLDELQPHTPARCTCGAWRLGDCKTCQRLLARELAGTG